MRFACSQFSIKHLVFSAYHFSQSEYHFLPYLVSPCSCISLSNSYKFIFQIIFKYKNGNNMWLKWDLLIYLKYSMYISIFFHLLINGEILRFSVRSNHNCMLQRAQIYILLSISSEVRTGLVFRGFTLNVILIISIKVIEF